MQIIPAQLPDLEQVPVAGSTYRKARQICHNDDDQPTRRAIRTGGEIQFIFPGRMYTTPYSASGRYKSTKLDGRTLPQGLRALVEL